MSTDKLQLILDNVQYITGIVSFRVVEMPSGQRIFLLGDSHKRYTGPNKIRSINVIDFLVLYCFSNQYPTDFYHEGYECEIKDNTIKDKKRYKKNLVVKRVNTTQSNNVEYDSGELSDIRTIPRLIVVRNNVNYVLLNKFLTSFNIDIRKGSSFSHAYNGINTNYDLYILVSKILLLSSVESMSHFIKKMILEENVNGLLKKCLIKTDKSVLRAWNSLKNKRLKKEVEDVIDSFFKSKWRENKIGIYWEY